MTITQPPAAPDAVAAPPSPVAPPRLAEGVELMGEYEGSGFKTPHFMARRSDGQVVQLTALLQLVAAACDGSRDAEGIAERVSGQYGRRVSAANVTQLLDRRLRPLGIVTSPDGTSPTLRRLDPMLALRFRAGLVSPGVVGGITTIFRPLFFGPVVAAVLLVLVGLDVWVFAVHGLAQAMRELIYQPLYLLLLLGLVIISAAFHECGHATACRYSGARPGVMGAGLYMVWPAFYTDVTDAYRLGRGGRLRTDLGGVYFNAVFILATAAVYAFTRFEPLLAIILFQHIEMIHQLLPFLRLDGYYIVADLTGVPDMFSRIKPVLASLVPGRKADERVAELKTWVRAAVTAWVLLTIPILLYVYGMLLISTPRLVATAGDSLGRIGRDFGDSIARGKPLLALLDGVQVIALVLPLAGVALTLWRTVARLGGAVWAKTEQRPFLRGASLTAGAVLAAYAVVAMIPRTGSYSPIRPDERGTIATGAAALSVPVSGRPLFLASDSSGGGGGSGAGGAPATPQPGGAPPASPSATPTPGDHTSSTSSGGGSSQASSSSASTSTATSTSTSSSTSIASSTSTSRSSTASSSTATAPTSSP